MIIAIDAMGGDNAPYEIVMGAIDAVKEQDGFDILLVGDELRIKEVLSLGGYSGDRIKVRNTTEVITNDDIPTKAIKQKKDSSMVVSFELLRNHEIDCFISAGSSGALLAGSVMKLKRINGVDRPAVASIIPTKKSQVLLIDSGFNTNIKPNNYLQFGYLGSSYMRTAFGISEPKVGLVNIGVEEEKGGDIVKEAYQLLKHSNLNFVGNIETRELFNDISDVVVCDGFTGNAILKLAEGACDFFISEMKKIFKKNIFTKMSALVLKDGLLSFKKKMDPDIFGGAPVLGIDGLVIKSHGSSKSKAIKYCVLKAQRLINSNFIGEVRKEFSKAIEENNQ